MGREIWAVSKLFISNLRYNKLALIFNLLFPTIYFFYTHQVGRLDLQNNVESIGYFWAYIVFISILNFMILPMISYRESGILKQLWLITSKQGTIISAMVLVYFVVIGLELIVFNLSIMVTGQGTLRLIAASLLTLVLFGPAVYLELTSLLMVKIKAESMTVWGTLLIFILFTLSSLATKHPFLQEVALLNPVTFLVQASIWTLNLVEGNLALLSDGWQLLVAAIVMLLVGILALKRLKVSPLIKQM